MKTKQLTYCAICVALNCLGAYISIPLGSLPITMQTFFACMSGVILGAAWGSICQLIYIALGLIGLPVFSAGGSGFMYILRPSFGYLIGFVFTSFIAGLISSRMRKHNALTYMRVSIISLLPLYIIGVPYQLMIMHTVLGLNGAAVLAALGMIPFYILSDIISLTVLCLIAPRIRIANLNRKI